MIKLFLLTLLLLGVEGMVAQTYTKGAVYDFNIGDEFHYRTSSNSVLNPPKAYIDRVLNRYSNSAYLFYEIGNISLTDATIILNTRIDSIPLAQLSDPIVDTVRSGIIGDTLTTDSLVTDSLLCKEEHLLSNSTLDYPAGYEPPYWFKKFILGLGEVAYYRVTQSGYEQKDLVYYKKGNLTCGESVYITSIQTIPQTPPIVLTPNPFTDQISIQLDVLPKQQFQFHLYNNLGQVVLKKTIHPNHSILFPIPKEIPRGIYYGVLYIDDQVQTTPLVKQ